MNFCEIIKLAVQRAIKNRKRNVIVLIPLIIMTILILFSITIQYSMQAYASSIEFNINMRTISSINYMPDEYEEIIEKLSSIDHIDMIVEQYESRIVAIVTCEQFQNGKTDGRVYETPINYKTSPEVIEGRKINENDKYVVIIPDKIYADGNTVRTFENPILESEYVDGKELLGKTIRMKIKGDNDEFYEDFEVVGIYDSEKYNSSQTIYIPKTTIKEINEKLGVSFSEYYMDVVVDKVENLNEVRNKLIEEGIINNTQIQVDASNNTEEISIEESNFISTTNINIETLQIIKNITYFLLFASFIILIVLLIITNLNKTYISAMELGILKVEGYKNRYIQLIIILENVIICIIGFAIALILFKILQIIGNVLMDYFIQKETLSLSLYKIKEQFFIIKQIPQKTNFIIVVIIFAIIILIESINTFFINKRILKKNISSIIKI